MLRIQLTANKRRSRERDRKEEKEDDDEERKQDKIGGLVSHFFRLFRWLVVFLKRRTVQLQTTPETEN